MFRIFKDTRIIMTSVIGYDRKCRACIPAPGRSARIFPDEKELIRYLAGHTDTHGYADPARWSNSLITRQYSIGRAPRIWTESMEGTCGRCWSWTENWEYWFHDAAGRTIDVRRFREEVTAAVRRGETSGNTCTWWKGSTRQGRRRHSVYRMAGQRGRVGFYLRSLRQETAFDEEGQILCRWMPRGKLLTTAQYVSDWDWFEFRSRRSAGWKEHKCRHQWEHNVMEKEKHEKNRVRKAMRRGEP